MSKKKIQGTVVCGSDGKCVYGNYKPTETKTAHERLAKAAGISDFLVAGSVKKDGSVACKSESVNRKEYGQCDMAGTAPGNFLVSKVKSGEVLTVKEAKAHNNSKTK